MCRAVVDEPAQQALAGLLDDMATVLAAQAGVARDAVLIGPIDFGPEHTNPPSTEE
jgi:hypothetical protein